MSTRVSLLLEHGRLPRYYFPEADIRSRSELKGETRHFDLRLGDVVVADGAFTHPPAARGPARHGRVGRLLVEGAGRLAGGGRAAIFETAMGPRWYFPRQDIRVELLEGDAHTVCAYKGYATYWSVRLPSGLHENIAWTYLNPRHDALAVAGLVAFFNEHVDLEVDGQPQPRSRTPWAAPRWWERIGRLEARM